MVVDFLQMLSNGRLTVTVNGVPLVEIDAECKRLRIEAKGMKASGLTLSAIITKSEDQGGGVPGLLKRAKSSAKRLSEDGWGLTLYDGADRVLAMGYGVSRVTGYVSASPLKLRRLLEIL